MTAAILIASIRDYRKRFRMQLNTFNRHNNPGVKAAFAKFASVIRIMSVIYGSCCSLLFCAIVVLLVFGRMSGLGVNLALFALVILWSGIPLMLQISRVSDTERYGLFGRAGNDGRNSDTDGRRKRANHTKKIGRAHV